ncbi:MAG: GntR family transcriptional regulator [Proteobacteria bacterium]|nr:GntR family transcriptional regulator [Pseudomonadota bacterium]
MSDHVKDGDDQADALNRTEGEGGLPLYVQLAQTIGDRIAKGEYAVGSLLPTEAELGQSFGVSRYTVRQAIQHLRNQGLVNARKGVGTRVQAAGSEPNYTQSMRSLGELLQYATETRLDVIKVEEISARGALAEILGCRPKKAWIRVAGIRHGLRGEPPHCHSEIYIDEAYRSLADEAGSLRTAMWSLIETRFGETVVEVDQEIEATLLEPEMARLLETEPGAPALKFTRRYYVTGRRLVEMSISLHPADRFSYHMTIRRGVAGA